jgi:hypothetical protein
MQNDYEFILFIIYIFMYFRTLWKCSAFSAARITTLCANVEQGCAFVGVQARVGNAGVHLVVVDVAQMGVFWVITPCMFISWSRSFEEMWCLRLQGDWIRFRCIQEWWWRGNWRTRDDGKDSGQLKPQKQIQVDLLLNQWDLNIRSLTAGQAGRNGSRNRPM